jgi:hypothetical protein
VTVGWRTTGCASPPAPADGLTGAEAGEAAEDTDEIPEGLDGMVGAEIVGAGGRMSDPYVGNDPAGTAGAAGADDAAGPAKYVAPESVTEVWLTTGGGAADAGGGASTAGACAAAGTVDPEKSDIVG